MLKLRLFVVVCIVPIFGTILVGLVGGVVFAGEDTHSGQAVHNALQASGHAVGSAAHGIVASGQVTSAVAAIPLAVGGTVLGSVGAGSVAAAQSSAAAATATIPDKTPLVVTDEVITIMPPNEALRGKVQSTTPGLKAGACC